LGEPPLLLGISVWAAVKDALSHVGGAKRQIPNLELPATVEQILMVMTRQTKKDVRSGEPQTRSLSS
jgi:xanthine dehydrogenase large subunit